MGNSGEAILRAEASSCKDLFRCCGQIIWFHGHAEVIKMLPVAKANKDAAYKDGFSSEAGNEGHPNKLGDHVSDTNSRRTSDSRTEKQACLRDRHKGQHGGRDGLDHHTGKA